MAAPDAAAPHESRLPASSPRAAAGSSRPRPVDDPAAAGLSALLRIEASAREAASRQELAHLAVNETTKLTRARQVFLVMVSARAPRFVAATSIAALERHAPLVQSLESTVERMSAIHGFAGTREFHLDGLARQGDAATAAYPLRELLWVPLSARDGKPFAGLLLARETSWQAHDIVVAERLGATYAHAWLALDRRGRPRTGASARRYLATAALVAAGAAMAIPVRMAALAPAEVVARDSLVVAAPIDAVIEDVLVAPNTAVVAGQVLIRFAATELGNRLAIAEQQVAVAEARMKRAQQVAFDEIEGRRELAVAQAESAVRRAERDYARDLFSKSALRADRSGVLLYADRKELIGRPVSVGQRLGEIAAPGSIEVRIDMPVSDALLLERDARVDLYLDSAPLRSFGARIARADYRAREIEGQNLAVRATAWLDASDGPQPRLGVRGTAQVYGGKVPLGFYLLRRPISAARQWLGL